MPKLLLLCGSLRAASINHILLEAAAAVAPKDLQCLHYRALGEVPLYNQDFDTADPPKAVAHLRQAIADVDGLLIATPEYNQGIPGVLKNAIDWASRPRGKASLSGKAIAVMVATLGAGYGVQASAQLRALLADMENFVVPSPLLIVQRGGEKLRREANGQATFADPMGQRLLAANWAALSEAIAKQAGSVCLAGAKALAAASPIPKD